MSSHLKLYFLLTVAFLTLIAAVAYFYLKVENLEKKTPAITIPQEGRVWQIKSVDTMKYSRDKARVHLADTVLETLVNTQLDEIKNANANYVAIATPYDSEFTPVIKAWVQGARSYGLNVWFRGNFSSWEGWFGYPKNLSREDHLKNSVVFVRDNPDLFENGDIFTACTECENGGPGDPRYSTTPEEFRKFMIDEKVALDEEFKKMGKNVRTNFNSMNLDVAKLVYDPATLTAMGNVIAVDHYSKNSQDEVDHIRELHEKTGAQIMLGEIGAPVGAIHGPMSEEEQTKWAEEALRGLSKNGGVIGINWWVNRGGETALVAEDNTKKPVYDVVKKYFSLTNL